MPQQSAPPIRVRLLQRSDTEDVQHLFSAGMKQTLVPYLRRMVWERARVPLLALSVAGILGSVLRLGASVELVLFAVWALGCTVTGVLWLFLPIKAWRDYVGGSLLDDMLDPFKYYIEAERGCFWVAVDRRDRVVGSVAVETPPVSSGCMQSKTDKRLEVFPWNADDVELRRMSVAPGFRGKGVATMLLQAALRWCLERNAPRLVLTTSGAQEDAVHMYRRRGFKEVFLEPIFFSLVSVHYFAKPLTTQRCDN